MNASKFSDAQKAFILKQGSDGMPVADICRKAGISQATYFNWKKKYDGFLHQEAITAIKRPTQPHCWATALRIELTVLDVFPRCIGRSPI